MSKFKVVIDPRLDAAGEKAKRQSMSIEDIIASAAADWDVDDPGVGRAVLTPDGREVFNPVPMAPPVGYVEGPSVFDQLYSKLRAELMQAKADEEVDTVESMNEYPDDDEPRFWTDYELVLRDEVPEMPPETPPGGNPPPEDPRAADLQEEEPPKKKAAKKPPEAPPEEA